MIRKSLNVFALDAAFLPLTAFAQPKILTGTCVINQELTEPPEIHAKGGTLDTTLDAVWKENVPVQAKKQ
jgi:hypothetical protein